MKLQRKRILVVSKSRIVTSKKKNYVVVSSSKLRWDLSLAQSTLRFSIRVPNGTGQAGLAGQRDRSFFIVPGQKDNGTSSKSCHGTGRDGIFDWLSRPTGQNYLKFGHFCCFPCMFEVLFIL